jgi:hypothetical protein
MLSGKQEALGLVAGRSAREACFGLYRWMQAKTLLLVAKEQR